MFSDPVKNVRTLGLGETNIVADLGAGTGFYSVAAGQIVRLGKVYAIEVQKDYLVKLRYKVAEARLKNVETIWGNVEKIGGTKLRDNLVDAVIASNILFQIESKDKFIEEIKRILKPGGRVLLIDWSTPVHGGRIEHMIPKNQAREMFEKNGFTQEREIDAGAHHYGMILVKK